MELDQSGSARLADHVKLDLVVGRSRTFVTLTRIGPNGGGCTSLTHTTRYQYDALDHKTTMTSAYGDTLAKTTTYSFDSVGNLLTLVDAFASPRTTAYAYDPADQMGSINYSDGSTPNVAYAYDSLGRRTSMVDGTGTTTYVFDSLGRLTSQTDGAGKVLGFNYDLKGQLTSIAYPNSVGSVTRTYDDAGRLHTILDWLSPGSRTAFTYTYDANSNVTNLAYPNSDSAAMTYNHADQMTQKTDTANSLTILSLGYTPDSIGLTTAEAAKTYTYDTINRVQTSTDNGGSTYIYDSADRLTQLALTGANTTTNVYNNADEITSLTIKDHSNVQVQQYTYAYDNNGNRTQQTDQSSNHTNYGYDQANRMISFSGGGHSATYAYNGDGLRMAKTVDSVTTSDVWMPVGQGLPVIVVDKIGSTTAYYVTGAGGAPLEQITGTTPFYYHSNMLGSTLKLTDSAGAVQQSYDYDPYGNPIAVTVSVANPFRFAGQYADGESGLYCLRARYYDPMSGQFVSRDPIIGVTRHPYSYALDSPLNASDPSGLIGYMGPSRPWGCDKPGACNANQDYQAFFETIVSAWAGCKSWSSATDDQMGGVDPRAAKLLVAAACIGGAVASLFPGVDLPDGDKPGNPKKKQAPKTSAIAGASETTSMTTLATECDLRQEYLS